MVDEDTNVNDDNTVGVNETIEEVTNFEETYFQLSSQEVSGQFSPKTLKFKGILDGLHVTVLIDTGSNHNILQPRITQHLKIHKKPIPNFSIMVGNGSQLSCFGSCPHVPITLQNHLFLFLSTCFQLKGMM